MKSITILLSLAAVLFLTPARGADTKATSATVNELLGIIQIEKIMTNMAAQNDAMLMQSVKQAIASRNLSPEQQARVQKAAQEVATTMHEELSPEKLKAMTAEIYSDAFTEEEVRAIITFYKTPAGKTMLEKQPVIMQNLMAAMQKKMSVVVPKIQQALEEAPAATGKAPAK